MRGVPSAPRAIGSSTQQYMCGYQGSEGGGLVNKIIARLRSKRGTDEGMTLVEVMVAIAIMAVVAIAGSALTINGLNTATYQQNRQIAVTIASGVMETVNSLSTTIQSGSGVSGLLSGRSQSDSQTAFTTNSAYVGASKTYPAWDKSSVVVPPQIVPISNPASIKQGGTSFTTTTLIGTCYEPNSAAKAATLSTGWDCTLLNGYASAPDVTPTGFTPVLRVIVIVKWTAGSRCTAAGTCFYVATSLFDYHPDLTWVSHD